jgi:hypothetical protein
MRDLLGFGTGAAMRGADREQYPSHLSIQIFPPPRGGREMQ